MGITNDKNSKISLKEIIAISGLTQEQKNLWFDFIGRVSDEAVTPILQELEGEPRHLEFLTKNLFDKMKAVAMGDAGAAKKIVEEEKEYMANME